MARQERIYLGAFYILLAGILYGCLGALVKYVGPELPDSEIICFRFSISLFLLSFYLFLPRPKSIVSPFLTNHIIRGLASIGAVFLFYFSLQRIPLADAMLLNNTLPLFIPLVAWIWHKEKIALKLVPALLLGFIGIALILHPSRAIINMAAFAGLGSGVLAAIAMVGIQTLAEREPLYRILFYYFAIATLISALPLLWHWKTPSPVALIALIAMGVLGILYQLLLTLGYSKASASKVSPFIYFAVIVSGLLDWWFWNVRPDLFSLFGLLLVAIGSILAILLKTEKNK